MVSRSNGRDSRIAIKEFAQSIKHSNNDLRFRTRMIRIKFGSPQSVVNREQQNNLCSGCGFGQSILSAGLTLAQGLTAAFETVREALPPDAAAKQGRPLRLSCNGTLAMRWLIPRLKGFLARQPQRRRL